MLDVFNIHGQQQVSNQFEAGRGMQSKQIDISDFPSGIFLIRININGTISAKQFIKL